MFGLVFAQGVCVMRYWLTPLLAMVSQAAERALQSVCARDDGHLLYLPIGLTKPTQEA